MVYLTNWHPVDLEVCRSSSSWPPLRHGSQNDQSVQTIVHIPALFHSLLNVPTFKNVLNAVHIILVSWNTTFSSTTNIFMVFALLHMGGPGSHVYTMRRPRVLSNKYITSCNKSRKSMHHSIAGVLLINAAGQSNTGIGSGPLHLGCALAINVGRQGNNGIGSGPRIDERFCTRRG